MGIATLLQGLFSLVCTDNRAVSIRSDDDPGGIEEKLQTSATATLTLEVSSHTAGLQGPMRSEPSAEPVNKVVCILLFLACPVHCLHNRQDVLEGHY